MCDGSVFWSWLYSTTTVHQQTRSDGSESPFPVLATHLKSEDGGGPQLHSSVQIGASSLQPARLSPATHTTLLRAAVPTPWRGRRQERCPRGGPPSATKPHRSVALHGLFCGALCKQTESFLSPGHTGVAATARPATGHPQGKRGNC